MPEPWDSDWGIGYDVTAAFTRKALDDAGITREQACGMTLRQLGRVPGMDPLGVDRLWAHGIHSDEEFRRWPKPRPPLTEIERAVLEVLAAAGRPLSIDAGFERLLPPKPRSRLGGKRTWTTQWMKTMRAWVDLEKAGMLVAARTGWQMYEITAAGREALGRPDAAELPQQCPDLPQ